MLRTRCSNEQTCINATLAIDEAARVGSRYCGPIETSIQRAMNNDVGRVSCEHRTKADPSQA